MKPSLHAAIEPNHVAMGMLELGSIADGYRSADRVAKEAPVQLLVCQPVSPGKFLLLFCGEVAAVLSSLRAGLDEIDGEPIDQLFLPHVDPSVVEAINGTRAADYLDALGVVETDSVATLVAAADIAVKTATVELLRIRFAMGLGGKAYLTLHGEVSQVRAAVHAASGHAHEQGKLVREVVIPRPAAELDPFLR